VKLRDRVAAGDRRPNEGRAGLADKKSMLPPAAERLLSRLRLTEKGKVST
jgi:hypothetical protein